MAALDEQWARADYDDPQKVIFNLRLEDAQKICNEELADPVTDWDRYADAWWRIQELEKTKLDKVEHKDEESSFMWIVMWAGMALLIGQLMFGIIHPALLVVAVGMMGPAVTSTNRMECALWGLLVMVAAFGLHEEMSSQAHAANARRAVIEQRIHLNCLANNRLLATVKLPSVNCDTIVP